MRQLLLLGSHFFSNESLTRIKAKPKKTLPGRGFYPHLVNFCSPLRETPCPRQRRPPLLRAVLALCPRSSVPRSPVSFGSRAVARHRTPRSSTAGAAVGLGPRLAPCRRRGFAAACGLGRTGAAGPRGVDSLPSEKMLGGECGQTGRWSVR